MAGRAQRRWQAVLLCVFTAFALQERWHRRIMWVLPRPKYWFENLLNSNALNMWWKENFRVTRETFHFICMAVDIVKLQWKIFSLGNLPGEKSVTPQN